MSLTQADHPGRWWTMRPDGRLECRLCPRFCKLNEGQRGFCFVRQRAGDAMVLTTYGRSSGFCVVHDPEGGNTWCPGCGRQLIERDWYELGKWHLDGNRCASCGYEIAGEFEQRPGHYWGPRRLPVRIAP